MFNKKQYSVIPIYSVAFVWIIWAFVFKFSGILSILLCAACSASICVFLFRLFPPLEKQRVYGELDASDATSIDTDSWEYLIDLSKNQLSRFNDRPIASSLQNLCHNIYEISKAIQSDPVREKNSYIRKFRDIYIAYSKNLNDYEACSKIVDPGPNVREILRITEERFAKLSEVSKLLLDEVYSGNILTLNAENDVLSQIFLPLETKNEFSIEY